MSSCTSCSSSTSVIQQYLQQLSRPPALDLSAQAQDAVKVANTGKADAAPVQPAAKNSDKLDITV